MGMWCWTLISSNVHCHRHGVAWVLPPPPPQQKGPVACSHQTPLSPLSVSPPKRESRDCARRYSPLELFLRSSTKVVVNAQGPWRCLTVCRTAPLIAWAHARPPPDCAHPHATSRVFRVRKRQGPSCENGRRCRGSLAALAESQEKRAMGQREAHESLPKHQHETWLRLRVTPRPWWACSTILHRLRQPPCLERGSRQHLAAPDFTASS